MEKDEYVSYPRTASKKEQHLAVAHCDEDFMTWIDGIDDVMLTDEHGKPLKALWDALVYERCGRSTSTKYSR